MSDTFCSRLARSGVVAAVLLLLTLSAVPAAAQPSQTDSPVAVQPHAGGEANLVMPDLNIVDFQGVNGRTLLTAGLGVCLIGLAFGMVIFYHLKNLPVHRSMLEISELIYET